MLLHICVDLLFSLYTFMFFQFYFILYKFTAVMLFLQWEIKFIHPLKAFSFIYTDLNAHFKRVRYIVSQTDSVMSGQNEKYPHYSNYHLKTHSECSVFKPIK
jgi:CBS domain containing-hemolysin-like protein